MLILIDQDGVLADFERAFHTAWQRAGHDFPAVALERRTSLHVRDDYPQALYGEVEAIYTAPGFYRDLPAIAGALDGMRELLEAGHDVRICTAPLNQYRNCVAEKFEWVEQHLGPGFVDRIILTKDKTVVHGDILVDDNPDIRGSRRPDWRQVLFDQPYNRHLHMPRMSWASWREALAG